MEIVKLRTPKQVEQDERAAPLHEVAKKVEEGEINEFVCVSIVNDGEGIIISAGFKDRLKLIGALEYMKTSLYVGD
jgi:hypothetical protein